MNTWVVFILLQILDLLSTLWFLNLGLSEGNFIINKLATSLGYPIAIFIIKWYGSWIFFLFIEFRNIKNQLHKVNWFFVGVVVWNLFWIGLHLWMN